MTSPRRRHPVAVALYLNAGLLGAILVAMMARGNGISLTAPAFGAPQPNPPAIGVAGNLVLMPAQFSQNTWGCYVLDAEKRNLCAYQYYPGMSQLRMVAARNFSQDLDLKNWNTTPDIREVQKLVELERNGVRGRPNEAPAQPPIAPEPAKPAPPEPIEPVEPVPPPTAGPANDPQKGVPPAGDRPPDVEPAPALPPPPPPPVEPVPADPPRKAEFGGPGQ
jgi:hypothetical protein